MLHMKWALIVGMFLTLTACIETKGDMEDYVKEVKKTAVSKIEPIPPPAEIQHVEYTAENLRSPFVLTGGNITSPTRLTGPGGKAVAQQPRPDLDRPREYLEQFPLTSLSMVGTLSKPGLNWGLVKDSNGLIHAVKVGDFMGQNSGYIVAISPNQIRLIETVPNGTGGWKQAPAALGLVESTAPETSITQAPVVQKDTTQNNSGKTQTTNQRTQQPQQQRQTIPQRATPQSIPSGSTGGRR